MVPSPLPTHWCKTLILVAAGISAAPRRLKQNAMEGVVSHAKDALWSWRWCSVSTAMLNLYMAGLLGSVMGANGRKCTSGFSSVFAVLLCIHTHLRTGVTPISREHQPCCFAGAAEVTKSVLSPTLDPAAQPAPEQVLMEAFCCSAKPAQLCQSQESKRESFQGTLPHCGPFHISCTWISVGDVKTELTER